MIADKEKPDTIETWKAEIIEKEHIKEVLGKIRAEIEERMRNSGGEPNRELAFNVCLQIIDKYRKDGE